MPLVCDQLYLTMPNIGLSPYSVQRVRSKTSKDEWTILWSSPLPCFCVVPHQASIIIRILIFVILIQCCFDFFVHTMHDGVLYTGFCYTRSFCWSNICTFGWVGTGSEFMSYFANNISCLCRTCIMPRSKNILSWQSWEVIFTCAVGVYKFWHIGTARRDAKSSSALFCAALLVVAGARASSGVRGHCFLIACVYLTEMWRSRCVCATYWMHYS